MFQKIWLGEEEDAAENKKNFFISIAFFCGFHSDSVRRTTVCTGVGAAEADSCRQNGGVTMDTEGLLVLETGSVVGADNESHDPARDF